MRKAWKAKQKTTMHLEQVLVHSVVMLRAYPYPLVLLSLRLAPLWGGSRAQALFATPAHVPDPLETLRLGCPRSF